MEVDLTEGEFLVNCSIVICGAFDQIDLLWEARYLSAPSASSAPTESQCNLIAQSLEPCMVADFPPTPPCPDPVASDDDPDQPFLVAPSRSELARVVAFVDLPAIHLADPDRGAGVFLGIDGLDRLTLLTAPLWGVTDIPGGNYMEHLYTRLPKGSILERREADFEMSLPDGRQLLFELERATHPNWGDTVVEALVLTSGQSPVEAAEILGLTPVRLLDAEARRRALDQFESR